MNAAISLRHIQCFIETARCASATEAARRLNISQPAASRRLTELESLLGKKLFHRTNRKLTLSDEGQLFLRYAESADITLKQGMDALAGLTGTARPMVNIGALPSVAGTLIPKTVQEVSRVAPSVLLRIDAGRSRGLLESLRAGELDMVIGRMPAPELMRGLHFEHLYSDQLGFVTAPNHPLLKLEQPTLTDILTYQCIVPEASAVIRPLVDALFLGQGQTLPERRIESVSLAFSATYLENTTAVWIISKGVAQALVAQGTLAFVAVDTATTTGSIGITTRFDDDLPPAAVLVVDTLKSLSKT